MPTKIPRIKFSHYYEKFPRDFEDCILLDVLPIKLEDLSGPFRDFDTLTIQGTHYDLPRNGDYLLLILKTILWDAMFTTIRRNKPGKLDYYRSLVGYRVKCIVEEQQEQFTSP